MKYPFLWLLVFLSMNNQLYCFERIKKLLQDFTKTIEEYATESQEAEKKNPSPKKKGLSEKEFEKLHEKVKETTERHLKQEAAQKEAEEEERQRKEQEAKKEIKSRQRILKTQLIPMLQGEQPSSFEDLHGSLTDLKDKLNNLMVIIK